MIYMCKNEDMKIYMLNLELETGYSWWLVFLMTVIML